MASSTLTSTRRRQSNRALLSILSQPYGKRPALPHELILRILDYPPCWVLQSRHNLPAPVNVSFRDQPKVLCCSPPFTARSLRLFGEVVFTIRSHDQGWCNSPDAGNWTWFDVQIENNTPEDDLWSSPQDHGSQQEATDSQREGADKLLEDRRMLLQKNRQAEEEPMSYTHSLDRSKPILYNLRVGDEIKLLGCARFPGWVNFVEEAALEIWGVDTLDDEPDSDDQIPPPEPTSDMDTLGDELDSDDRIPTPEPTSCIRDMAGPWVRFCKNFRWRPSQHRHSQPGQ